ncbi:MAG TPA: polymer-forming cytoskeletal protein [Usitatibacter sp.]|nr:polymer-forming cytoskeletal protein [Usitatibacter sp.]
MKYGENLFARRDPRAALRDAGPPPASPSPSPTHPTYPPGTPAAHPRAVPQAASVPPPIPAPVPEPAAPPRSEEPAGSKLIVGPNIKLRGVEIDDCDTLVVEGRVEATMVSRAIQIAENGAFNGKVDVDVAEIRGDFKGEMTARRKLVIHSSGRVSGKIRYGKMLVQEGGEMSGDIGALDGSPPHGAGG